MRSLICATLFVVTMAGAGTGRAEDPRTSAADHYARGIELAGQGLYEAALEQFNDAYTTSPNFAVLYNIGEAQMALGRPLEAVEALSKYIRDGADQVPLSRREQVQAQIDLLESRLAELSITTDRVGAAIRVDGRDVGRTPLFQPIRLAAGTHTVTASLADGTQQNRDVTVKESERRTLDFAFGIAAPSQGTPPLVLLSGVAAPPAPPLLSEQAVATPPPWYERRKTMRWTAYAAAGASVLCGGAALGVYLANRGNYDDWRTGEVALAADTKGSAAYRAQAISDNALAGSLTTANHAILGLSIASGVLIGAGATLFFVDRAHRHSAGELSFGWGGSSSANVAWSWLW